MRRGEAGAAAVELAVALPILLLMVFGLIQVILLVNAKTVLDHAAYEAARTGIVMTDAGKAERRALRVVQAVPRGAGFLDGKPKVRLLRKGDSVIAEVKAKILLLPFFRQASLAAKGDGTFTVTTRARRKKEPYLGY